MNKTARKRRHKRIRSQISGTVKKPRLCVFRSAKHISAQLIDDEKGKTLVSCKDSDVSSKKGKTEKAFLTGKTIAEKAKKEGIEEAVFDRGGYKYHGRIKALREGAVKGGLKI